MHRLIYVTGVVVCIFLLWTAAPAAAGNDSSHKSRQINPEGCAGCHSGRGVSGGGLLKGKGQVLCYRCHSRNATGRGRAASDIESVMRKSSHHPVEETSHLHRKNEVLPAQEGMSQRHVTCSDCHLSHVTSPGRAWNGVPGYRPTPVRVRGKSGKPQGQYKNRADFEYELCYRCHSDGPDTGLSSRDISSEFDPENMSYHPVEMAGRNYDVPSLVQGMSETSVIKCGSCHGNSDPLGAAGPHGSDYAPLLIAQYRMTEGAESAMSYTLCYICHDRQSIQGDESFKSHRYHVVLQNISCISCHNSHGSRDNSHLIDFSAEGITNSSDGIGPVYQLGAPGMPKCFLSCHGADHSASGINGRPWTW